MANGHLAIVAPRRRWLPLGAGLAVCLCGLASPAYADCGSEVRVRAGDTLSSIAARCNVSEGKILRLNPGVDGSKDLHSGMHVTVSSQDTARSAADAESGDTTGDVFGRLRGYAKQAGESVEDFAKQAGHSVEQVIKSNPDLHQRVLKLGQTLHIPGVDGAKPQVSLSTDHGIPGTPVTLSVIGLAGHQHVEIAGGPPGSDYKVLAEAQTSAAGTLQVTLNVPQWAKAGKDFIFVVASAQHDVAARSPHFSVVGTTGDGGAGDTTGGARP